MSVRLASLLFFFSSRRRHTRLQGDWSSDVCSSDLRVIGDVLVGQACGDGLHQQVGLVLGVAAGRSAQAHQGREAAGFVDGVFYVAGGGAQLLAVGGGGAGSLPTPVSGGGGGCALRFPLPASA